MLWPVVFLAIFLRLFHFPKLSWFFGDQGVDLMVAQRALHDGVWPWVGPYLGVPNFFVPPSYYWLLTAFLWIGKTPEVVTLFFILMDIVALVMAYKLASLLVDGKTGYIVASLYAVSTTMINHARNMWQPHPVQVFLFASLYFFAHTVIGRKDKTNDKSFIAAWGLYGVALSIYPSPIVLLPFFLYHAWRWVSWVGWGKWVEWLRPVCLALLAFFIAFIPWIVFEAQHGWTTAAGLFSGSFGALTWKKFILQALLNSLGLLDPIDGFSFNGRFAPLMGPAFLATFGTAYLMVSSRFRADPRFHKAFSFISSPLLAVGFLSLLLFRDMGVAWHRLHGFAPFVFLAFAMVIRIALSWHHGLYRLIVVSLASVFLLGNGLAAYGTLRFGPEWTDDQIGRARRVAAAIDVSAARRGINAIDFSVIAYTPSDVWSYAVTPELYFLRELRRYPVPFTWAGNDLDRAVWGNDGRPYIYLLCKEYTRVEDVERTCLAEFSSRNPSYTLGERLFFTGDTKVFLFRRAEFL